MSQIEELCDGIIERRIKQEKYRTWSTEEMDHGLVAYIANSNSIVNLLSG